MHKLPGDKRHARYAREWCSFAVCISSADLVSLCFNRLSLLAPDRLIRAAHFLQISLSNHYGCVMPYSFEVFHTASLVRLRLS